MYFIYDNDYELLHYMSFEKLEDALEEVDNMIKREESVGISCEGRFVIFKQIT